MTTICGPNMGVTVTALRDAIAPYFAPPYPEPVDLDGYFRALGEAALLPADCSALVSIRQVSLALIAICTGLCPAETPTEALRVAGFTLHSRANWLPGGWHDRPIALPDAWHLTFLDFVEQQIEAARGALPDAHALSFIVGYDEAAVQIPPSRGGGMLSFVPAEAEQRPGAGLGRGIGGAVIEIVAGLFGPIEQQQIDPEIAAYLADALARTWPAETIH